MADLLPAHLRTFLSVCDHMSFTRAGEERLLTQPAVSRQMRQLEGELGVPVFDRIGRGLHLTQAGEALRERAKHLLAELERAAEAVRAMGEEVGGVVRIGASTTPGLYLLPPIIRGFAADHVGVEIDYRVDRSRRIERLLLENAIDLGYVGEELGSHELVWDAIAEDEIVCLAASAHPLAQARAVSPKAVAKHVWVVRQRGSATRNRVDGWFGARNLQPSRVIELAGAEDVKAMIAAGVGVGFASVHGMTDARARGLVRLHVRGLALRRTLYCARHRDKYLTPTMAAFVARARSAMAPAHPGRVRPLEAKRDRE